ncbi:whirlin isoform X5 [Frankliniella occidentalis]|uniref:Whirlin isoform X5 n=1 Tax=Frankliniella occidentalis TaxID=133901 RepID=A0A9C6XBF9_FRAOC|nr:whirlin isoform X5 [Frankliniella occidentalis]
MAEGEEFAELAESNHHHHHHHHLHQYGSSLGHGGGHGGHGGLGGPHRPYPALGPAATSHEAEDAIRPSRYGDGGRGPGAGAGGGGGAFYSPPGTSYTIVERPSSAPRGTYLGAPSPPQSRNHQGGHQGGLQGIHQVAHHAAAAAHNKKRPISPEQVLKLLGAGVGPKVRDGSAPPASDPPRRRPPPTSPPLHELPVRTVTMTRTNEAVQPGVVQGPGHGFGICVKGGAKDTAIDWDRSRGDPTMPFRFPSPGGSNSGVYISRVEDGSVAQRAGLRPGDVILEVNGTPFSGLTHEDALKMLKSCKRMTMTVRAGPAPYQPPTANAAQSMSSAASWSPRQAYTWMDRTGRPVSPPPSPHTSGRWAHTRKVELSIEPGQSLGLMIRGGVEYNLGVFITGVDKDSVADRAGLAIGDQILEVNGQSFLDVTHDEAVAQLKLHKRMTLTVRDVGKVPHSCSDPPPRPWDSPGRGFLGGSGRSPALQMVEEKARVVLTKTEFATLAYYQEEYAAGQMTIEAFVAVLLELLNTPEKYTLLTELREVVVPEDRARFDELVYRREVEGRRCVTREYGSLEREKLRGRRHSSPENSLSGSITGLQKDGFDDSRMLPHKMGRSFELKDDQELLESDAPGMRRHHSMQRLGLHDREAEAAMVVADQLGNLRITVRKTKPLLGIAIEGGANTKHPLPRIINIHEHGAAYEAGGLEVGQLILEVDGHRVEAMHHQDIARMIAESFARRDRSEIEFLVIEAKKSNLEPKPTALIFLEG